MMVIEVYDEIHCQHKNNTIWLQTSYEVLGPSWPWSYCSWIYNYICNRCPSKLMLWVWIPLLARCTTLCNKVCHWLAQGSRFSPGTPVFSINKTDRTDITEILLKVALNTIKPNQTNLKKSVWSSSKYVGVNLNSPNTLKTEHMRLRIDSLPLSRNYMNKGNTLLLVTHVERRWGDLWVNRRFLKGEILVKKVR